MTGKFSFNQFKIFQIMCQIFCKIIQIFSGNVEKNLKFNFGSSTRIDVSCGATLNGKLFIIGGYNEKRQVINLLNDVIIK